MASTQVPVYCPMCTSTCGCIATVDGDEVTRIDPDPSHPTGESICGKGRASVGLVNDASRVLRPLMRTRHKGSADPGWVEVDWDVALEDIAHRLQVISAESGPEAVTVGSSTPSGTALLDSFAWIDRLTYIFGTPNFLAASTELCQWHRDDAYAFTFGVPQPPPDITDAGCLLLWGHNPRAAWLARMTRALEAGKEGMALIAIDPRREGLASKADVWLRVRPGADGALALSLTSELMRMEAYDPDFVRGWTTAPALVRRDTGRLLRAEELGGSGTAMMAASPNGAVGPLSPGQEAALLEGESIGVATSNGDVVECETVFSRWRDELKKWTPERAEEVAWVDASQVRRAAKLMGERHPVAHASWTGVGQGTNATQTARAISCLYALTGDWDKPGGNVEFAGVPVDLPWGYSELSTEQRQKALGIRERPLGPASKGMIGARQLWRSISDGDPYRTRAFIAFGINPIMTQANPDEADAALRFLEFHVHIDQTITPTARYADYFLPANTHWERESVQAGFLVDETAQRTVQWRPALVPSRGESKSDLEIVCELAAKLGLSEALGGRTPRELYDRMLEPAGLTVLDLEELDRHRLVVDSATTYRKYAERTADGTPVGFPTESQRVELFTEDFIEIEQEPLPTYIEPAISPYSVDSEVAEEFPLVLTSAKLPQFCHSQHRNLPLLRRAVREPGIAMNPDSASERGLEEGDWVRIRSPQGQVRARLQFDENLDRRVAVGQFGWWQPCPELDEPGYPPLAKDGSSANFGLLIDSENLDPISGSQPLRQYICEVEALS